MIVIGIDFSMSSPGLCVYKGPKNDFSFLKCELYSLSNYDIPSFDNFHFNQHKEFKTQQERFHNISEWVLENLPYGKIDFIGLEDYSMGSRGKVFNIGENTGILKYRLWQKNLNVLLYSPKAVKKYATQNGNSDKQKMVDQFGKDTGIDLKKQIQPNRKLGSPTSDLVDAFYICKFTWYNNVFNSGII